MFALTLVSFMTTTAHWVSMAILNTTLLRVGFVDLPGSDIIAQFQKAQLQVSWIFTFDVWPQTVVVRMFLLDLSTGIDSGLVHY